MLQVFLGTPELARTFTIRAGETYLRRIRRNKERERRKLQRGYKWLPHFDEGEAPW